jgi:hypothetical protein
MGKPEKHVTMKEEAEEIKESPANGPVLWDAEEGVLLLRDFVESRTAVPIFSHSTHSRFYI